MLPIKYHKDSQKWANKTFAICCKYMPPRDFITKVYKNERIKYSLFVTSAAIFVNFYKDGKKSA